MSEEQRPTLATDIEAAPESILVTLSDLKTRDGAAVRVLCLPLSKVECTRILEALPGERPKGQKPDPAAQRLYNADVLDRCGGPLVEAGTALLVVAGELVRPAFYCGPTAPHPNALPWRTLTMADASELMETILKLSGFLGGAAEAARFHARNGAGG